VITSELIRENEANLTDHSVSIPVRNLLATGRDQPTFSPLAATTKVKAFFNPVVEYLLFGKIDCMSDTIESSLAAAQGNRFRIQLGLDAYVLQNQITTQSDQTHPDRVRSNSAREFAQDVSLGPSNADVKTAGVCLTLARVSAVKAVGLQLLRTLDIVRLLLPTQSNFL
jgi:hypothetical protein